MARSLVCLSLLVGALAVGCTAPADDEADLGDESSEAITASTSLLGTYGRQTGTDPILSLSLTRDFGSKTVRFLLVLDPQVVAGACVPASSFPCDGAAVEGTLKSARGSATKGSFTLVPRDPTTLTPATTPFVGNYTFTRSPAGLVLRHTKASTTQTLLAVESPVKGPPTDIAGTWKVNDLAPAGAGVYVTIDITPGAGLGGTFTAKRSLAAGAPTVSGTYEVGPPNEMIGLAPFFFHEAGAPDMQLFVGAVMRDAAGKIVDLGVVLSNQPSRGFNYQRQ